MTINMMYDKEKHQYTFDIQGSFNYTEAMALLRAVKAYIFEARGMDKDTIGRRA